MISRRTIFALLFALLLGAGLWVWSAQRRDECSAFLGGDRHAPSSQVIHTGTRTVAVPCGIWVARQPALVQLICLLTIGGLGIFLVSVWTDWKRKAGGGLW